MRRLLITTEREQTIEIDESKMEQVLRWLSLDKEPAPHHLEQRLAKDMESGEVTVDNIAGMIGTPDGHDKYADARAEVELQEQCPKHPHVWFNLSPKGTASCWMCANERRKL